MAKRMIYELFAIWNRDCFDAKHQRPIRTLLRGVPDNARLKCIDENTEFNRSCGIDLAFSRVEKPKFPIKLVSASYRGNYERCKNESLPDPEQGGKTTRKYYREYYGFDI